VDYLKAVQDPTSALPPADEFRGCSVEANQRGLPKCWSGSNAIVFRIRTARGGSFALRCFTQKIQDAEARYQAYTRFYANASPDLRAMLVPLRHLPQGIYVPDGTSTPWKPVVLMAWVEGQHLGAWVETHRTRPSSLRWLQEKLRELGQHLTSAKFVHGDLHHKNIMVGPNGPILVDYDSVLLPGVKGLQMTTQGLPSFRHPLTSADTPPEAHDRFALLVLHVGLEALIRKPDLFDQWGKVEGLLFQGSDFREPGASPLFRTLLAHPDLRVLASRLTQVCQQPPARTPDLTTFLNQPKGVANRPAQAALPPWSLQHLTTLGGLYAADAVPHGKPRHIRMAGSPQPTTSAQSPRTAKVAASSVAAPTAKSTATSTSKPSHLPRLLGLGALALLGMLLLRGWQRPWLSQGPSRAILASIRSDLEHRLEAKKDLLLPLIIHIDEELQTLQAIPDEVRLATLNPTDGTVTSQSIARLRLDLATTREQARQALLRCNGVLDEFDGALKEPGLTPAQQAQRIVSIKDLPTEVQSRVEREFPKEKTP
jgi:hypothetical protein